jgi:hypothetical protein
MDIMDFKLTVLGRLRTNAMAPAALCSASSRTDWEKLLSSILGMATSRHGAEMGEIIRDLLKKYNQYYV